MGRGMRIAVLGAVVVGSVGGGLAAWYRSPRSGARSPAAAPVAQPALPGPPSAAPSTVTPGSPAQPTSPATTTPDPHAVVVTQVRSVLARFAEWSRDHAGAPCPDGAALGSTTLDPWGHQLAITCTDQPADQRIGAISGGADGVMGSDDDVASWTLGRDVTDLVRGARWKPAPDPVAGAPAVKRTKDRSATRDRAPATAPAAPSSPKPAPATSAPATSPRAIPIDAGGDDIPARR